MPPSEFLLLWGMALALASALATEASIRYARWRGMLDHAGQRRSHVGSVPRGGGIGIVLSLLLAVLLLWEGPWSERSLLQGFAAGLALVAAIGWIDDHLPQPAWRRLLVHFVAALLLLWSIATALPMNGISVLGLLLGLLAVAAAINFWNFMDGINGLASLQALFVSAVLAHAFWLADQPIGLLLSVALVVACAGFLPFNLPRARVFLGDVGSGAIGFAIAALLLHAISRDVLDVWTALLLPMAFWLDAGLTLAMRIGLGRRWYTAHREHLYQWLVRRGRSHASVDALFLGWNLLIVLPAYLLIINDVVAPAIALAVPTLLGACGWVLLRQRLLDGARYYGYR